MNLRERIAVPICVAAAAVGAVLIYRGYTPFSCLNGVGFVWWIVGEWLNTNRWRNLHSTPREIYEAARRNGLYSSPLARTVSHAAFFILIAAAVCWLRS